MDASASLIFILLAFATGGVIVWKKDTIPPRLRRAMAITSIVMILFAFFIIVYAVTTAG